MTDRTNRIAALKAAAKDRVLVFDGSWGVMIQRKGLAEQDFRGDRFANHPVEMKGNNDILCVTRPDIIEELHNAYYAAGADISETNTFSATMIAMDDYKLDEQAVWDINLEGARIGRRVADEWTAKEPHKPRFLAGSIGPLNKMLSMSSDVNDPGARLVDFDEVYQAYRHQVAALYEGGVDLYLIETITDTLNCKAALKETDGDVESAIDWLRKKGLAKAAKKAGRTAADGLVAVATSGTRGVVVEVNSETDFVARNETFQKMVSDIAGVALEVDGDLEKLKASAYPGADKSIEDYVATMVGQIGENMTLRRTDGLAVQNGAVVPYIHTVVTEGAGKIGVLVALESTGDTDALHALGKQLAMHVAAARPLALKTDDLDPAVVQREKDILSDQARASGKPENIIEKMVEGRLRKFYEESVLLEQVFVIDNETKISKVVENAKSDVGADVALVGFVRFELGEGVEVSDDED